MESADIAGVAERLVDQVTDVPPVVVLEVVSECVAELDTTSPLLLEHAARARLSHRANPGGVMA